MYFLILGALIGLVGALPALLRQGPRSFFAWWAVGALFWSFVCWLFPFQLVGPLGGAAPQTSVFAQLVSMAVIYALIGVFVESVGYDEKASAWLAVAKTSAVGAVLVAVIAFIVWLGTTSGMFHSADYRAFVAENVADGEWDGDVSAIDPAHLRQVPLEMAKWKGNKALSQAEGGSLGSQFAVGEYVVQKVGTELMWVAPLEFQGFAAWEAAEVSPGYVMVSAEDPNRDPVPVLNRKMVYVESAYFGANLWRHVVLGTSVFRGLTDPTFEIDEDGNPFYVYTRYELTVGYSGLDPVGALIVNPETGEMNEYALDALPEWVDRVMPEAEAYKRLVWNGEYGRGWWNSVWGGKDIAVPTDYDLSLVWTDDGRACWFTGLTSNKSTDHALMYAVLMDSRTGSVRRYAVEGAADEADVMGAVRSAVSNFSDWVPSPPIPENVYGDLAWVVPVVTTAGVPQRIAIVNANASKVALGENVRQALAEYRRKMAEDGGRVVAEDTATEERVVAAVARFAADVRGGNSTYLFTVAGDERVFSATSDVSAELPLTRTGDTVAVGFLETEEAVVPVERFDNLGIAARVSDAQRRADEIAGEQPLASPRQ